MFAPMSKMKKLNMRRSGGYNLMAWYTAVANAARRKMPGMDRPVGWTRGLEDGIVDLELLYWAAVVRVEYLKGCCEKRKEAVV